MADKRRYYVWAFSSLLSKTKWRLWMCKENYHGYNSDNNLGGEYQWWALARDCFSNDLCQKRLTNKGFTRKQLLLSSAPKKSQYQPSLSPWFNCIHLHIRRKTRFQVRKVGSKGNTWSTNKIWRAYYLLSTYKKPKQNNTSEKSLGVWGQ